MDPSKTSVVVPKLTQTVVNTATPAVRDGKIRQRLYLDSSLKGFGLLVGREAKTYVAQRDIRGRTVRVTIGRTEHKALPEARREAMTKLALMATGVHPEEADRRARSSTLQGALDDYLEVRRTREKPLSEVTLHGYEAKVKLYLKDWLALPLADINRQMVVDRHQQIAKDVQAGEYSGKRKPFGKGQYVANQTFRAFRAIYNAAALLNRDLPVNPCIALKDRWFEESRRTSALTLAALPDFWKELEGLTSSLRADWWRVALFTGLRRSTVSAMRWDDIDFEKKMLHIPNPKGGDARAFDLPLPAFLVELLLRRREENKILFEGSSWVFPAASVSGHMTEPRTEFSVAEVTPHDMRRLFITVAEGEDLSPYVIKLLCNHAVPKADITGGYMQIGIDRLRPAMEKIAGRLQALCTPSDEKVAQLPRKVAE